MSKHIITESSKEEHDKAINLMSTFFENDNPKVGIFWLNPVTMTLFGVQKEDAPSTDEHTYYTYKKLHKSYWQKQHNRAVAKNDTKSIYYNEHDYTKIPRSRIWIIGNKFVVKVGTWFNDIDIVKFSELLEDEFNLPSNFEFDIDEHWNLGRGWSEEKF